MLLTEVLVLPLVMAFAEIRCNVPTHRNYLSVLGAVKRNLPLRILPLMAGLSGSPAGIAEERLSSR